MQSKFKSTKVPLIAPSIHRKCLGNSVAVCKDISLSRVNAFDMESQWVLNIQLGADETSHCVKPQKPSDGIKQTLRGRKHQFTNLEIASKHTW